MGQVGLWQQGKVGPYLPVSTIFHNDEVEEIFTKFLNTGYDNLTKEKYGFMYLPEVKEFCYVYIYPRITDKFEFVKAYAIILTVQLTEMLAAFFLHKFLEERFGSVLLEIHNLDKKGQFEDIVKEFTSYQFQSLLDVSTIKEKLELVDRLKLIDFKELDSLLAYILNGQSLYILSEDEESTETLIHLLNIFLSDMINIREYTKFRGFLIQIIERFNPSFISDRRKRIVLVKSKSKEIITDLKPSLHHAELEKYRHNDHDDKLLYIKGYIQRIINDYFHQIRSVGNGDGVTKKELQPFIKKLSFYDI